MERNHNRVKHCVKRAETGQGEEQRSQLSLTCQMCVRVRVGELRMEMKDDIKMMGGSSV